jgi:hypothetical protein
MFVSSVGNNDVPYPYAESASWVYDMCEQLIKPVQSCLDRVKKGCVIGDGRSFSKPFTNLVSVAPRSEARWVLSVWDDYLQPELRTNHCLKLEAGTEFTMCNNTCGALMYCNDDACYGVVDDKTCEMCGKVQ